MTAKSCVVDDSKTVIKLKLFQVHSCTVHLGKAPDNIFHKYCVTLFSGRKHLRQKQVQKIQGWYWQRDVLSCVSSAQRTLFTQVLELTPLRALPSLSGELHPRSPRALQPQSHMPWDLQSLSKPCHAIGVPGSSSATAAPASLTSWAPCGPVTTALLSHHGAVSCPVTLTWSTDWPHSLFSELPHHHKLSWGSGLLTEPGYHSWHAQLLPMSGWWCPASGSSWPSPHLAGPFSDKHLPSAGITWYHHKPDPTCSTKY